MLKSMCPLLRQVSFQAPIVALAGLILLPARLYEELPSIRANIAPITV